PGCDVRELRAGAGGDLPPHRRGDADSPIALRGPRARPDHPDLPAARPDDLSLLASDLDASLLSSFLGRPLPGAEALARPRSLERSARARGGQSAISTAGFLLFG